jgi:hypothetical protein
MKIYFALVDGLVVSYNLEPTFEYTHEVEVDQEVVDLFDKEFPFIKYIDNKFIVDTEEKETVVNQQKLYEEKGLILNWFKEHDWIINKVFIGEWTKEDKRWLTYLKERQVKRNRLDQIENEI